MIKIIITIFLLVNISSKEQKEFKDIPDIPDDIPQIKFGEDTQYDKNNNKFIIPLSTNDGELLFYLLTDVGNCMSYWEIHTSKTDFMDDEITPPGISRLFDYNSNGYIYFNITGKGKEKGTIWVYPLNKEIDIDFSQKYGKMLPVLEYVTKGEEDKRNNTSLKYVVSYLEEDKKVIFKYQKYFSYLGFFYLKDLSNPFKVCQGDGLNNCVEKVEDYTFKKNETYTIYVQFQKKDVKNGDQVVTYNVLAGYSFYDKNKFNNERVLRFSFVSLILLFLF